MDWYYIILIVLLVILILLFLLTYICFKKTFYSKNKKRNNNDIYIPNDEIHQEYKDTIYQDVKDIRNLVYTKYSIKSHDGLTLTAKYYECNKNAPIEIMFHGYRGNAEIDLSTGVKRAFKCGRNVLLVSQRGSQGSDGHVITFGIKERFDCVDWVNFVVKEFGSDVKIILTGISMGAATVVMAGSMDIPSNVIGIIADCGYNKPKDIIIKVIQDMKLPPKLIYPFIKLSAKIFGKFDLEEYSPLESVKKIKAPVFFVHGTGDTFIPIKMTEKLYDECISRKVLVPIKDGKHGTSYMKDPDLYITELEKFFK